METPYGKNLKPGLVKKIKKTFTRKSRSLQDRALYEVFSEINSYEREATIEEEFESKFDEIVFPETNKQVPKRCGSLTIIHGTVLNNLKSKQNINKAENFLRKTRNKVS